MERINGVKFFILLLFKRSFALSLLWTNDMDFGYKQALDKSQEQLRNM